MPLPSYGAAPLSKTFFLVRVMQVISMLAIVGMTANFIGQIVAGSIEPPKEFVGTLSITCIATLYCLVSIAFFWSQANMGLFVMTAADSLLLIAFIVVSVTLGKPVSYLNCYAIRNVSKEAEAAYSYRYAVEVSSNFNVNGSRLTFANWIGNTKSNCFQTKAVWGFSIALCILFTTSVVLLPTLWYKNKKASPPPEKEEC